MAGFSSWKKHHPPISDKFNSQLLALNLQHSLRGATGTIELAIKLHIAQGSRVALLGPSGSGKTSLLRMLAGLMPVDQGHIQAFGHCWLDTTQNINLAARHRKAGMVFQDYALFPHMTALGNLLFALPKGRAKSRAMHLLESVGLEQLAKRYPQQLSGGQQQRLALARALAAEPELLLLDEPLSALDTQLRRDLQSELLSLQQQTGTTLILVTHDPGEALRLADRAILLKNGQIVADAPPAQVFNFAQGAAAETLVLQGRVRSVPAQDEPQGYYLIEAEGQICRAHIPSKQPVLLGEPVMLSAREWVAQPFTESIM